MTIPQPFAVGKFEITLDEWHACYGHTGCLRFPFDFFARSRAPVRNVSWSDVKQYVAWLARVTGKPYRLLTEAEWEYARSPGGATGALFIRRRRGETRRVRLVPR